LDRKLAVVSPAGFRLRGSQAAMPICGIKVDHRHTLFRDSGKIAEMKVSIYGAGDKALLRPRTPAENESLRQFTSATWTFASSSILGLISLIVMWGWLSGTSDLVQTDSKFARMQLNTALCFFATSIALIGVVKEWRILTLFSASAMLLFALASGAQYLLNANLGPDAIFIEAFKVGHSSHAAGMLPGTAAGFVLTGIAVLLSIAGSVRAVTGSAIVGGLVLLIGLMQLLGDGPAFDNSEVWGQVRRMALQTSVSFSVVGGTVIVNAWRNSAALNWLPLFSTLVMAVLVSSTTYAVHTLEGYRARDVLRAEAAVIPGEFSTFLTSLYVAIDRMADHWTASGRASPELWWADVGSTVEHFPFIAGVALVDADRAIEMYAPEASVDADAYQSLIRASSVSDAFRHSMVMGGSLTTGTVPGFGTPTTYLYIVPLLVEARHTGFLVAVISTEALASAFLASGRRSKFGFILRDGETVVASSAVGKITTDKMEIIASGAIYNHDRVWGFTGLVTPDVVFEPSHFLSWSILAAGTTVTLILFFTLRQFPAARYSANTLETVMDTVFDGVITTGEKGNIRSFNASATRLFGYEEREVLGKSVKILLPEPYKSQHDQFIRNYVEISQATNIGIGREMSGQRKDGTVFPMELGISEMRLGDRRMFVGTVRDVTKRNRLQRDLETSEATFRAAMEHATIGMVVVDPSGRWLKVNQSICSLLGYGEHDLLSFGSGKITHPDDVGADETLCLQAMAGEFDTYADVRRYIHRTGRLIWVQVNASLVRNANGSPKYFIKQVRDITDEREMDEMKSEFVSVVSHELRTPLTSISGSLGLLSGVMGDELSPKVRQMIDIAHKNSIRLVRLINDILDIDKIRSGEMRHNLEPADISMLVEQGVQAMRGYAEKFNVTFVLKEVETGLHAVVDQERCIQVLTNLLSNAAKFSPHGGSVEISAKSHGSSVRVAVRDWGMGIPDDFHKRVFGKFSQADSSITRKMGGTGLGLHISKAIVEQMGGTIGFDSEYGKGATFWVELPMLPDGQDCAAMLAKVGKEMAGVDSRASGEAEVAPARGSAS
jgi:PAS domain S-box-containing protein